MGAPAGNQQSEIHGPTWYYFDVSLFSKKPKVNLLARSTATWVVGADRSSTKCRGSISAYPKGVVSKSETPETDGRFQWDQLDHFSDGRLRFELVLKTTSTPPWSFIIECTDAGDCSKWKSVLTENGVAEEKGTPASEN
jgi:hypothetical protein